MKLFEFLNTFSHNNLIRLVYNCDGGHEIVAQDWDSIQMDWEIIKGEGLYKDYVHNKVLGLVSIRTEGLWSEAINIVIER